MVVDEEQPRHRAPEARVDERDPADQPHVVAERAHPSRLVARALERRAEGRADEARHHPDGEGADHEREVIEGHRLVEIQAEGGRARKAAQPVVAVGHRHPAIRRAPQHLRERERQHEEAQARRAQRDQSERAAHQRRREQRDRRRHPVAEAELELQERRDVRGDAKIGGMAERRQAAVAEQQIDARGEHREDHDLAREVDVVLARDQRQSRGQHAEDNPPHAANLPKSPRGRNAITRIMGRKRITYARSGSSATPKV